jgi:AraC family transcriptional activator of tynA and feaB
MQVTGGRLRVDGPATPETVRAWNDAVTSSRWADSVFIPTQQSSFAGNFRHRMLEDLVLLDAEAEPFGLRYQPGSEVSRYIGFSVNLGSYRERVVFEDGTEIVKSSPIDIWDTSWIRESETLGPMAIKAVFVPKSILQVRDTSRGVLHNAVTRNERGVVRLLRDFLLGVIDESDDLGPVGVASIRNAIVELMYALLHDGTPAQSMRSTAAVSDDMRRSICRWVDSRLQAGQISPSAAAEDHGISVRSLHRLFAGTGDTFGSLVRRRRLDRARRDLVGTNDMIQTIAVRWGYADASHFIYEFKRVHGTTPAAHRQARLVA